MSNKKSDIDNSNIFYKNNNIDNINSTNKTQILSMFILTEKKTPCIDPTENIWRSESNKECKTKVLGKSYDERYEKKNIIKPTAHELYNDNSMEDNYQNISKEEIINLYARSFIGFKTESIDKYDDYERLISKQKLPNICGNTYKYIFRFPLAILSLSTGTGGEFICLLIIVVLMIIALILSILLILFYALLFLFVP